MATGPFQVVTDRNPRQRFKSISTLPTLTPSWTVIYGAFLVAIPLLVTCHGIWAVQALLAVLLLSIPGLILLRAVRIPGRAIAYFPALIPCASIVVLLGDGLALDLVGPVIGINAPLRTLPILATLEITCAVLLASSRKAGPDVDIPWKSLANPGHLALPLALPLIAAIGAIRLNNGHGNIVAAGAIVLCILALTLSIIFAPRIEDALLSIVVYSAGLSLMWSYSLRGALVYGFDIATEYQRLTQTVSTGVWHVAHPNDAYGAMLSVTVMPAELHFLSGLSSLLVLKVVFPLIGALFPLEVFALARRVLSRRWALVAAAFTLGQASFSQGLTALARQQVALALFAALVAVMLSSRLRRGSQWGLVVLLGLAMVVSHYSTTYVAVTVLGLAVVLQWVISFFRDVQRITGPVALAFVVSLVGALVWYGWLTRSGAGIISVGQAVSTSGLDLLPSQGGGNIFTSYLNTAAQQTMSAAQYQRLVHVDYVLNTPSINPYPDAGLPVYALKDSTPAVPPIRLGILQSGLSFGTLVLQQLLNLVGSVGAIVMLWRKKVPTVARQVALLALASVFLLIIVRLSGTLATFYNSDRVQLQTLTVFSIAFCWSLQGLAGRRERGRRIVTLLTAMSVAGFMLSSSGLAGVLFGGGTGTNLANSGEDYERFFRSPQELGSASWLGMHAGSQQLVYADRYAQLPLVAMTGMSQNVIEDVTPLTINQTAWIYASTVNIVDGRARVMYRNALVSYTFPGQFLNSNFDVVYTNGASEVFFR